MKISFKGTIHNVYPLINWLISHLRTLAISLDSNFSSIKEAKKRNKQTNNIYNFLLTSNLNSLLQDFFPVSPTLRGDLLGLPGTLRVMANVVRFPAIESHDNLFLRKGPDMNTLREPAFVLPYPSQHGNAQLIVMGRGGFLPYLTGRWGWK